MNVQLIQERFEGEPLECPGGGVYELTLDIRISVDQRQQGWSIASVIHEELRKWLADLTTDELKDDSSYIASVENPDSQWLYEEEILDVHVMTRVHYVRSLIA